MHFDSQNQCFLIFLIVLYCNFSLCICCLAALLFTTPPPSFSLSPAQLRLALCYVFCCCICCRKILLLHFIYKSGTALQLPHPRDSETAIPFHCQCLVFVVCCLFAWLVGWLVWGKSLVALLLACHWL